MPYIKAIQFQNPTNQHRFDAQLEYEGTIFEYNIFLTPLKKSTDDFKFVVDGISKRRQKGNLKKACLGTTKKVITGHLKNQVTSAYGFIREKGSKDEVSGSIQLFNWSLDKPEYQVWINDLCRNTPPGSVKSAISPMKPLFVIFEQLAAHLLGKKEVYLLVEPPNETILVPLYEKYGFVRDPDFNLSMINKFIVMKKPIAALSSYNGFPFALHGLPFKGVNKKSLLAGHNKTQKVKRNKSLV